MNYGQIIGEIASIVEDTSQSADTDIRRMVNNKYRTVWAHAFWPELEKTYDLNSVLEQQTYLLSAIGSDLGKVRAFLWLPENITTDYAEVFPERDIAVILREDNSVLGDPQIWCEWEAKIYLWPVPVYAGTNNMRVLGKKTVADLADDADEPFFPAEYHEILINGGAWAFFNKDDDTRAQIYKNDFEDGLQVMEMERVSQRDEDNVQSVQFAEG